MKFTDYLINESKDIFEGYMNHQFIKEIGEGTLPKEKFLNYLIQDYIYLKDYAKVFCMGVIKADTMDEMKFFYKSIAGVLEAETDVHIEYMNKLGVDHKDAEHEEPNITTTSYTSYMNMIALTKGIKEITMTLLPCTLSYSYIGKELEKRYNNLENNYYSEWIQMYAGDEYTEFTNTWIDYTNELCKDLSDSEKEKLKDIFIKSSIYEMHFWDMAYS